MSSSRKNIIIDIPQEYLINGKTLLIEKYFQLFVDGYHLPKPSNFIKHVHQLCLVDTQQQYIKSIQQLQSNINHNQIFQFIIEIPSETLNIGKSVRIEKIDSNDEEQQPSGNFQDLYNQSIETKDIYIKIPQNCIERGKTIIIQKEKIFVTKSDDYQKEQNHHLINNQFYKQDQLQLKNMMEIKIEIPPEFFDEGRTITITKEDPQILANNFPYRRQSKPDL